MKKAVALFSGGKDSTYALWKASQGFEGRRYEIETVLSVHPDEESYMYHVPAIDLTSLAAESMGKDHVVVEVPESDSRGEKEVEPLKQKIKELVKDRGIEAVVTGAVESEYQKSRIDAMCEELGIESVAPLWHCDTRETIREIVDKFEVMIIGVAAGGLDESWLGRSIDSEAINQLEELNDERGVHVMGEGGEFETLVLDGPHMEKRLRVEYEKEWDGVRGEIKVTQADLETK